MKVSEPTGVILFEEVQHFPKWLKLFMICSVLITLAVPFLSVQKNHYNKVWLALAIAIPIQLILYFSFIYIKLEKIVTRNGLFYRWLPLQKKFSVLLQPDIKKIELRQSPMFQYGYGIFPGFGQYHNMSNGKGIQLWLVNGRKVFFGSDDPLSFEKSVREFLSTFK